MHQDGTQARVLAACLDTLAIGIVICAADGKILFANAASEKMTRAGGGLVLRKRGKRLEAGRPVQARALRNLIEEAVAGRRGGALNVTGAADNAGGHVVLVTPLGGAGRGKGHGLALVAFRPAADQASFSHDTLTALFRLSPAQAMLALALYDGQSVEDYAARRGIKISTARTHLTDIFAKTGTQTQRALVRLLGTLPPVR